MNLQVLNGRVAVKDITQFWPLSKIIYERKCISLIQGNVQSHGDADVVRPDIRM